MNHQIPFSIGGIIWNSYIDYSGNISIVLFINGCNLRCNYCHNNHLWTDKIKFDLNNILKELNERKEFNSAVVLCGGEPLFHKETLDLIYKIKKLGYKIKLDTNGCYFNNLKEIINEIDYLAVDFKTIYSKYPLLQASEIDIENFKKTVEFLLNSNYNFEFRTTVYPEIINTDDLNKIKNIISKKDLKWYLQPYIENQFKNNNTKKLEKESLDIINSFGESTKISDSRYKFIF